MNLAFHFSMSQMQGTLCGLAQTQKGEESFASTTQVEKRKKNCPKWFSNFEP
jgi:predicted transcriptional regulator with HTH domain